jgi:hypothetical protein
VRARAREAERSSWRGTLARAVHSQGLRASCCGPGGSDAPAAARARPGCCLADAPRARCARACACRLLARTKALRGSKLATEKATQRAFVAAEGFVSATDVGVLQTAVNALSKTGSLLAADKLDEAKTTARRAGPAARSDGRCMQCGGARFFLWSLLSRSRARLHPPPASRPAAARGCRT